MGHFTINNQTSHKNPEDNFQIIISEILLNFNEKTANCSTFTWCSIQIYIKISYNVKGMFGCAAARL